MKLRNLILSGLPIVMLVCLLLPAPAQAQFYQQGPKLVGTGIVGLFPAEQGSSVSLSGDGNTAIVGGPHDNNRIGAAWVYTRSAGVWSQQAKLAATDAIGSYGVFEGLSVSLSGDGDTAIIGGWGDNNDLGAAWVFTRSGGVWGQQAKLVGTEVAGSAAAQGNSVALSGDGNTAIVGGPVDNNGLGAAWVFIRSGGAWSQQAKLVGADAIGAEPEQGFSVSLSADGNTAILGGQNDDNYIGAAWVFTRSGGVWSQQAKLVGTGAIGPCIFLPQGPPPSCAEQGYSVALSGDGNTAILGGLYDNDVFGAAWVFTRSAGAWSQQAKLVGTGAIGAFPEQGFSVSLSGDGNAAIVGGPQDNVTTGGAGAAWVFTRSGGVWSQQAKLVGTGAVGDAGQGLSVALSGDGNTVIVGGPQDNVTTGGAGAGAAWVFAPFAGTPGKANCYGQSTSTLVREFGGLNAAAEGVGFSSVTALQNAVLAFCEG